MADSLEIFISWSGQRSKSLAIQLRDWLKAVVQRSDPWVSERDIDAGQRWNEQISARLKSTNFGIICLTPENLSAPWLLFEAGALAKALDAARLVPVLLGVRKADLTFPLAQFQAVEADREGLFALASAVNRATGDHRLPENVLVNIFEGQWAQLETALQVIPLKPLGQHSSRRQRSDREVLEDILDGLRAVQRKVGGRASLKSDTTDTANWEDYYIRAVNLANAREGHETDVEALRAYSEAIALSPAELPENDRSRLYAYRGAILKRLGRLEEAQQDLLLAQKWAREEREINDVLYNLAGVAALGGRRAEAISLLRRLVLRDTGWVGIVAESRYFKDLQSDPDFRQFIGKGRTTAETTTPQEQTRLHPSPPPSPPSARHR